MKNRLSEQLRGFLHTNPLWEGAGPFGIDQFKLPTVSTPIPQKKEILHAIPSLSSNFVLGKRMESFFSYWISHSTDYTVLLENLQISREKITIGEIDFIIKNENKRELIHIELVYKFYVYDPGFNKEKERWIGPNRRDSLLRKIKKIKEYQFPLIDRTETRQALSASNIATDGLRQKVCFKANLFVPRYMLGQTFPYINNTCIEGYWLHLRQFDQNEFHKDVYFAPKKQDWPVNPEVNNEWIPFSGILKKVVALHEMKISPLLWRKTAQAHYERFFVVWW